MTQGIEPHWSEVIRGWASGIDLVLEVWAFGSRVRGPYRIDSDLDIAILVAGDDDQERLGNAICLLPEWEAQLQSLLPIKLDVQSIEPDDQIVAPAVRDHGLLLYRAGETAPRS